MKTTFSRLAKGSMILAMSLVAMPAISAQEKIEWGDFKLFIDPGHSLHENRGIWGYSEAEKTLGVALNIKDFLETYTTAVDGETFRLCRYDEETNVGLQERSDVANAWGADFFYSIHSDASGSQNSILGLFGGWRKDGVEIEKTPNGGKAFGELLLPDLSGVMRVPSRGNWYDRCFYDRTPATHTNQWPYLSVNRESNMASILSEGGYHDMVEQQQRNLNTEYKRLEAFAAFQTILKYRGFTCPAQALMTGVISNSENGQPINGAVVTVGDKTYTTDTFESLFNKYTRNEDLIHNGFYFFEGFDPGAVVSVTITADGYETWSGEVTIKNGQAVEGATSADYVTFLDVALTNVRPAVVSSVSAEDLENVRHIDPLVLTFSRNMDRESVEQALSIDNGGDISWTWVNDYTLSIDVSKLDPWFTYNIKIDGSIAKNSQTQNFFDGDGDGQPGGDYILTITMAEPDTEAPYVVSSYPAEDGEVVYTHRPMIRLQFNEEIMFNGDKHDGCIVVKDAKGKTYTGLLTHEVVAGKSVIHFFPAEDLTKDCAVLVTFVGGIADASGNVAGEYSYRFLTEYRDCTFSEMIQPLVNTSGMWTPGGSGSTSGIVNDESTVSVLPQGPTIDNRTSFAMNYVYDIDATVSNYFIRDHYPAGMSSEYRTFFDGVLTMWVYGDCSYNQTNVLLRTGNDGIKMRGESMPVDFCGWNQFVFDFENDAIRSFTGSNNSFGSENQRWCLDAISLEHQAVDEDEADEDNPFQAWSGTIGYNSLLFSRWDNTAVRTAQLSDIELPSVGIVDIDANLNAPVEYFNLQGVRVDTPSTGVYIRRQGTEVTKVVVK